MQLSEEVDDASLWSVPWVLNTGQKSEGAISKTEWHQSRYASCWNVIEEKIAADDTGLYVRDLEICDMTGPLADLCSELFAAKGDIENANCIASGNDCEILSTFYTPSQWSATNQAFARETVRGFYLNEANDSCAGEPRRIEAAEREAQTALASCPASSLETVKEGI
eukprot:3439061-Rhodomonas_salina.1